MRATTGEMLISIWFGLAILIEVVSIVVLRVWLGRHRGRLAPFGLPGYHERAYVEWCRSSGRSATNVLILRRLSVINVILALAAFILFVATR